MFARFIKILVVGNLAAPGVESEWVCECLERRVDVLHAAPLYLDLARFGGAACLVDARFDEHVEDLVELLLELIYAGL